MSDSLIGKTHTAEQAAAPAIDRSAYLPATPWLQLMLVCCLFALWGMAGNLNDILIAQFKKGFDLTDTQTALVQSIFFLGYFLVALPAAAVIKRYSYKVAIVIGLCLYALGCFLFIPAAQIMTYGAFLACLGVIAAGLSFLETSANTYSSLLGPLETSTQRINFSQIFNSLGVIFGVLIGQQLVFGKIDPTHEQLLQMPAELAEVARTQMVSQVVTPYLIIGSVLVVLALIFVAVKFPACKTQNSQSSGGKPLTQSLRILFALPRFRLGVLSQFLYVGAQVGLWSFTIRFVQMIEHGTTEHSATYWLIATLVCYCAGKVVTTALMKKFNPALLLGVFCSICVLLLLLAVNIHSLFAVVAIMGTNFCMALCWPTNFGLTIKGLGEETQVAGSIVVMSIIGGAVVPLIMGMISDANGGNMQIAFAVPLLCFAYVAFYGFYCVKKGI